MDIYKRLEEMGIELPTPAPIGGVYIPVRQAGNLLFVSGQGPTTNGKPVFVGKVDKDLSIEQGQDAARLCIVNMLSALDQYLGDLNKIDFVVKVFGLVASSDDFNMQPSVINGGSQLLVDIFGEDGRHARSAMGTNELPGNIPVEIEAIFQVKC